MHQRMRTSPIPSRVAAAVAIASLASGCATEDGAGDHRTQVVASFAPVAEAATMIGGEHVVVTDLTPPGVEPHDLELSPEDLETIGSSDLVLYLGAGFQPAVEDAVGQTGGEAVDLLGDPAHLPLTEDEHGDPVPDPHVWLSPLGYGRILGEVAEALTAVDPEHEASFDAATAGARDAISALDEDFAEGLADCRSDLLVTGHEAFGYLAAAYGLEQVGVTGVSPEAEPTPDRLAEIRTLVVDEGVTTVFAEDQLPPDAVETIARETGATVAVLDTIESAAAATYVERMRSNLEVIRAGLGCD
jgi:zinc transport system substrate-binding protein